MIDMKSSGRVDGLRGDVEEVYGLDGCRRKVGAGARGISDIPDGIMKLADHRVIHVKAVGQQPADTVDAVVCVAFHDIDGRHAASKFRGDACIAPARQQGAGGVTAQIRQAFDQTRQ